LAVVGLRLFFPAFLMHAIIQSAVHERPSSAILVLCAYALSSATGGAMSVYLSEYSQRVCGQGNERSCPFTAQMVWLALQFGLITGTACTFAVALV
jgi:hypothetical protein